MKTDPLLQFQKEVERNIEALGNAQGMRDLSLAWIMASLPYHYSYNFSWLGRPIIQYPQDIVAMQELIWMVRPTLVVETGIAHGGSLLLSASLLALLDYCDAAKSGHVLDPQAPGRCVVGIDVDIRPHNRAKVEAHAMAHKVRMIEGSSVAADIIADVRAIAAKHDRVLVILDSNHTHDHVLQELEAYAPLVSRGSYCVVFDTVIEDMPADAFPNRPWGKGNNPKTAVWEYLRRLREEGRIATDGSALAFERDGATENRLSITVAPDGYLRRV